MKLLIATDLSKGSVPAAQYGFRFAERLGSQDVDTDLTVVHAIHSAYPKLFADLPDLSDPDARAKVLDQVRGWVRTSLDRHGLEPEIELREGRPDRELAAAADEHDADWLAVGVAGHGRLTRLVIGSTAEQLAHKPPCKLAICHPRSIDWEDRPRFLVGLDFTRTSSRALQEATRLAHQVDARLDLVHVVAPPTYESYPFDTFGEGDAEIQSMEQLVDQMDEELDGFLASHEEALEGLEWSKHIATGYPTQEIVDLAKEQEADGIFLGSAGRSAVADFLMGSVERGVVKNMPCSVFLTPPV